MKKYSITAAKKYMRGSEEKKIWLPVGTITEFDDGGMVLELNMFPNQQFSVFENKPKQHLGDYSDEIPQDVPVHEPDKDISNDDLPF